MNCSSFPFSFFKKKNVAHQVISFDFRALPYLSPDPMSAHSSKSWGPRRSTSVHVVIGIKGPSVERKRESPLKFPWLHFFSSQGWILNGFQWRKGLPVWFLFSSWSCLWGCKLKHYCLCQGLHLLFYSGLSYHLTKKILFFLSHFKIFSIILFKPTHYSSAFHNTGSVISLMPKRWTTDSRIWCGCRLQRYQGWKNVQLNLFRQAPFSLIVWVLSAL